VPPKHFFSPVACTAGWPVMVFLSSQLDLVRSALDVRGAATTLEYDGSLSVRGIDEAATGDLAAREGLVLHGLARQSASLEEVFMELTSSELDNSGTTSTEGKP
jgi:ABC-2 type transport system ATP-binding protein